MIIFVLFQPVGFVTFNTRAGAEAAKQDLQVRLFMIFQTVSLRLYLNCEVRKTNILKPSLRQFLARVSTWFLLQNFQIILQSFCFASLQAKLLLQKTTEKYFRSFTRFWMVVIRTLNIFMAAKNNIIKTRNLIFHFKKSPPSKYLEIYCKCKMLKNHKNHCQQCILIIQPSMSLLTSLLIGMQKKYEYYNLLLLCTFCIRSCKTIFKKHCNQAQSISEQNSRITCICLQIRIIKACTMELEWLQYTLFTTPHFV